ncbi:hypothetical protein H3C70_02525 [Patescibacteria group bacterium]|nr:hypothetical protein [Patescibacteria group bacterium]
MTSDSVRSVPQKIRTKKAPIVVTALAALVLSFGLLFGVQYIGQQQNLQQQASQGQTVLLRMNGQTVNNNEFHVDFYVNSRGYALVGTQVTGKITGVNSNEVSIDLNNGLNLQPVGSKINGVSDGVEFTFTQFAPLDKSKIANTNGQEVRFATITVRKNQGSSFTVTLDPSETSIPVAGAPNVTLDMTTSRSFTIGQYYAPASANPSPSAGVGDQGIHRGCNEYCADKNECAANYSCYNNRCRNPLNITSENCSNPPSPKPTPQVVYVPAATPAPASPRPTPTPSPSPSPVATASASPTATPSGGTFYDEGSLRVSPSPTIRRASPSPSAVPTAQSGNNNRLLTAGLILLVALGIVVPVGIYLYRRVR